MIRTPSIYLITLTVSCPAEILVGLLTLQDRLPQGAPTSPAIADLVLRPVDEQVHAAAQRLGVRVTRYVDDFAFSGPSRDGLLKLRAVIERELRTVGLAVNHSKDTLAGRGRRQVVHGLVVNGFADGRLSIPKEYRKALERDIFRAGVFGINRDHAESLRGQVRYVGRHHPRIARRLAAMLTRALEDFGGASACAT